MDNRLSYCIFLIIGIILITVSCEDNKPVDIQTEAFTILEQIRMKRKSEIISHLTEFKNIVNSVNEDSTLLLYFDILKHSAESDNLQEPDEQMSFDIDKHFVSHYGHFYDLLFVDTSKFVFHSVKQESDYHTFLSEDTTKIILGNHLELVDEIKYIDFDYYYPSGEPASFHIIPIINSNIHQGWIVLQHAVNCINSIMTKRESLGRTGETYLVNSNNLMLSNSRFLGENTILQKKIETDATRLAEREIKGNKIIRDYRDVVVYSSFEKFEMSGNNWTVVAEIDEKEILTNYFRNYGLESINQIIDKINVNLSDTRQLFIKNNKMIKVDMGEYRKSSSDTRLITYGVATCSAVSIVYPNRFAYLAHITPVDNSYNTDIVESFSNIQDESLVAQLINNIRRFDVYPYELSELKFTIVINHKENIKELVNLLLSEGIYIDQITIMYNSTAKYANVILASSEIVTCVEWVDEYDKRTYETSFNSSNLLKIFKNHINY